MILDNKFLIFNVVLSHGGWMRSVVHQEDVLVDRWWQMNPFPVHDTF
jgi:hypothetical protein